MKKYVMMMMAPVLLLAACHASNGAQADPKQFSRADIDNSGGLDIAEYSTLVGVQAANGNQSAQRIQNLSANARTAELKAEFNALDENHDGRLSRKELGAF